jgi:oligopeptide/dipeptide ABC transporter ATP-binding protein
MSEVIHSGAKPLLEVNNLKVTFEREQEAVLAVRGVSFAVRQDSCVVIVGESGSGKSVTARAVLGLVPSSSARVSGSICLEGQELMGLSNRSWREYRGSAISMVFQDPMRSLNPTMRIGNQVGEGLQVHFGLSRKAAHARAVELLDLVGIASPQRLVDEYPHQLSGGMRQRIMMAIAISCNPRLLIADEPTTALDVTTEAQIMELLMRLKQEMHMSVILITHDMGLAFTYGDEVAVMYSGRIVEHASSIELQRHVRMPYTRGLLDSVPRLTDPPHSRFRTLAGRASTAATAFGGCSFAPRCDYAQAKCKEASPILAGAGDHQWACWYPL